MRVGKIGESLLTKVFPCCSPHQHSVDERLKVRLKSNLKMDTQLTRFQASNSYGNKSNWLFSLLLIQLLAFSEIWTDSFNHVSRCKRHSLWKYQKGNVPKMETFYDLPFDLARPPPLMAIFPDMILPLFLFCNRSLFIWNWFYTCSL